MENLEDAAGYKELYKQLMEAEHDLDGSILRDTPSEYSSAAKDRNGLRRETYKLALLVVAKSGAIRVKHEYELASQFTRSGTAPGALTAEYFFAESDPDRRHKLAVALKEANECKFWTCLLMDSHILPAEDANQLLRSINTVLSTLKYFHFKHS